MGTMIHSERGRRRKEVPGPGAECWCSLRGHTSDYSDQSYVDNRQHLHQHESVAILLKLQPEWNERLKQKCFYISQLKVVGIKTRIVEKNSFTPP